MSIMIGIVLDMYVCVCFGGVWVCVHAYIFVHLAMVHTYMSVLALCVLVCCSWVYMCTMHVYHAWAGCMCMCICDCTVGGCNTCVCAHAMFAVSFVLTSLVTSHAILCRKSRGAVFWLIPYHNV